MRCWRTREKRTHSTALKEGKLFITTNATTAAVFDSWITIAISPPYNPLDMGLHFLPRKNLRFLDKDDFNLKHYRQKRFLYICDQVYPDFFWTFLGLFSYWNEF